MLLSLSAQHASGQSIRDHCLVHSCAEIGSAPVSGQPFDWQLGPGDCVCVVSCLWMLSRLGVGRLFERWGVGGGWISRHKLPLSAWAIMALHCPAASLQYGYDLSLSLTPSPGPLQSPPYSRLQYQAVRANLCFVLVCLNRLDVTSACGMCPVFSCQSEARVSGRSVAGAVWIRG